MERKRNILFVDDDTRILRGLRRMLHPMRSAWEMHFAASAEQALATLEEKPMDVVVSDIRMPGMSGGEMLRLVAERYPGAARIVLSGQSDEESVLRSTGLAHQYLSKPCDAQRIVATVRRVCALHDILVHPKLTALISRARSLPAMPLLYRKLNEMLRDPDVSVRKIGELIAKDVGITAKILQLVNSAFFGLYRHISNPEQAVSLVGLKTLKALVLSMQLFSEFDEKQLPGFPIERLSSHSVATGPIARMIARTHEMPGEVVDDAFMAALLHDAGKLVLAEGLGMEYGAVLKAAAEQQVPLWQMERKMIQATHAEVGAFLLGLWGLPNQVVESVAFHHEPLKCPHTEFAPVTATYLANILEHEQISGVIDGVTDSVAPEYLESVGCRGRLDEWRKACEETVHKA